MDKNTRLEELKEQAIAEFNVALVELTQNVNWHFYTSVVIPVLTSCPWPLFF